MIKSYNYKLHSQSLSRVVKTTNCKFLFAIQNHKSKLASFYLSSFSVDLHANKNVPFFLQLSSLSTLLYISCKGVFMTAYKALFHCKRIPSFTGLTDSSLLDVCFSDFSLLPPLSCHMWSISSILQNSMDVGTSMYRNLTFWIQR